VLTTELIPAISQEELQVDEENATEMEDGNKSVN
jgi:hypothetical protein